MVVSGRYDVRLDCYDVPGVSSTDRTGPLVGRGSAGTCCRGVRMVPADLRAGAAGE